MKIAVLGSNGIVGKYLSTALKPRYNVTAVTRNELDLRNTIAVIDYFSKSRFDIVINAAINPNHNMKQFDVTVLQDNLAMFTNLYTARSYFGRLINFGSGAEFDRSNNIDSAVEEQIFFKTPPDHYGLGKNICSRIVVNTSNFYTLRLFGVFHPSEPANRLLHLVASSSDLSWPGEIQDKYFDYLFLEDLLPVVDYYITTATPAFKDLNIVYEQKILLSNFINQFCNMYKLSQWTSVWQFNANYTGNGSKLKELGLPLQGLTQGLKSYAPIISQLPR